MVDAGKVVVIAGDSWGCGEWSRRGPGNDYYISHPGLAQYISDDGYTVVNLSQPGAGNGMIADRLRLFFETSPGINVQTVIVFQSDFMRDNAIRFPGGPGSFLYDGIVNDSRDMKDFESRAVSAFYYSLSGLAKQHQINIYLIGGHCDTEWLDAFSREYPGVKVICQSMFNFLMNDDHRIDTPMFSCYDIGAMDLLPALKERFGIDLGDRLELPEQRSKSMGSCPEFFYPDNLHANRQGHEKLYKEIVRKIL